jgi:CheY-like chemotaxis protein
MGEGPWVIRQTRVLVVDDDAGVRDILAAWLQGAGYAVLTCPCGETVVSEVLRWQPTVILLDVLMAPVDGFSVLRDLRAQGLVPGIPVILLSAYLSSRNDPARLLRQVQELGARAWLSKPPDFEELLRIIDHPLEPLNAPWLESEAI